MSDGSSLKKSTLTCYMCGRIGHMKNQCTYKNVYKSSKPIKKAVTNARSSFANPKANRSETRRCYTCDVTRGPRLDSPWPSHIKYTTMVGITICIVIRLQESVVACVLQPWSGGKDPDRYNGIRGDVTDTRMMMSSQWRTIQCSKPSGTTQVITHLSLDSWGVKVGVL
jgi:hypothetical protein